MKLKLAGTLAGCLIALASLSGLDFWEKDPTTWSDKEVGQMLKASPWSHEVSVVAPEVTFTGGLSGGAVGNGGLTGRGNRAANDLGGGSFMSTERTRLLVRWASAWPVKRALARQHPGEHAEASDSPGVEEIELFYRIAILGIPFRQSVGTFIQLQDATVLKCKNKEPIKPANVMFNYEENLLTVEFSFEKTPAITVEDKEVEFSTRLGMTELKTKFKLKDLVIGNQLAL